MEGRPFGELYSKIPQRRGVLGLHASEHRGFFQTPARGRRGALIVEKKKRCDQNGSKRGRRWKFSISRRLNEGTSIGELYSKIRFRKPLLLPNTCSEHRGVLIMRTSKNGEALSNCHISIHGIIGVWDLG